jgi:hypothetical protein
VNQPMKSALVIVLRLFVFGIPLAFAFSRAIGVTGVFAGLSTANVVVGLFALALSRRFVREVEARFAAEPIVTQPSS